MSVWGCLMRTLAPEPRSYDGPVMLANPGYIPMPEWKSELPPEVLFDPDHLREGYRRLCEEKQGPV